MNNMNSCNLEIDPLRLKDLLWPSIRFYDKQVEIIYSVWNNPETVVHAGNKLGKDFVAGFITLAFFLTRSPCRILTTSADYSQLESVLWGEIRRLVQTSKYPLTSDKKGPLICNHLHYKKMLSGTVGTDEKSICGLSYIIGRTAAKGEGMYGHHIADSYGDGKPRTLFIGDEASSLEDGVIQAADTWADRKLLIGNPNPCNNYFYQSVEEGSKRYKPVKHLEEVDEEFK